MCQIPHALNKNRRSRLIHMIACSIMPHITFALKEIKIVPHDKIRGKNRVEMSSSLSELACIL